MRVTPKEHRVGEQSADVVELRSAGLRVDGVTHWVLHPRVGGHDETGREHRAGGDDPDTGQVDAFREPVPAEDPEPEKGGLQEKSGQALHGQGAAKDVTHEAGIGRPVHPELELLNKPGHHSDRNIDKEQVPKKRVRRRIPGSPDRCHMLCIMATKKANRSSPARKRSGRRSWRRTAPGTGRRSA